MEILVERKWKKPNQTIGIMSIDGKRFCETLEDTDRERDHTMAPSYMRKLQDGNGNGLNDDSITAIPRGTYKVTLDVVSPKFNKKDYYRKYCGGKVPRILNVPGFDGILMHCGYSAKSSAGCLILGYNKIKGGVIDSQKAFELVYRELMKDKNNLTIKIL